MKKLLSVLLIAAIALGLTACAAIKNVTKFNTPDLNVMFEADSVITTKDMEITAHMKRFGNGYWQINISKPDTLAGLEITYGDEAVTVKLGELSFDTEKSKLNGNAVFKLIFDAVDHAAVQNDLTIEEKQDALSISGENDNGKYIIHLDKDSKVLKGIEIPDHGISVSVHNFQLMNTDNIPSTETTPAAVQSEEPGEAVNAAEVTGQPAEEVVAPQETVAETAVITTME